MMTVPEPPAPPVDVGNGLDPPPPPPRLAVPLPPGLVDNAAPPPPDPPAPCVVAPTPPPPPPYTTPSIHVYPAPPEPPITPTPAAPTNVAPPPPPRAEFVALSPLPPADPCCDGLPAQPVVTADAPTYCALCPPPPPDPPASAVSPLLAPPPPPYAVARYDRPLLLPFSVVSDAVVPLVLTPPAPPAATLAVIVSPDAMTYPVSITPPAPPPEPLAPPPPPPPPTTITRAFTVRFPDVATRVPVPVEVYAYTSYVTPEYVATDTAGLPVVVHANPADEVFDERTIERYFAPVNPEPPALLTLTARSPRMR